MKEKIKIFTIVGMFLTALFFIGFGSYGVSTIGPKEFMRQFGSAASVTAGVVANPYNTLAQALSKKEIELETREAEIAAKEAAAQNLRNNIGSGSLVPIVALGAALLLLFLILLNFYLDWKRSRSEKEGPHLPNT